MEARCGSKIISINSIQYEIPELANMFLDGIGDFYYISGITSERINDFKSNWYYNVKNVKTNEFKLVDWDVIDRIKTSHSFKIYNVNKNDYAIPINLIEEADFLVVRFSKYNLKYINDFKSKFDKFIIKHK
jgi:hypothetical protein